MYTNKAHMENIKNYTVINVAYEKSKDPAAFWATNCIIFVLSCDFTSSSYRFQLEMLIQMVFI